MAVKAPRIAPLFTLGPVATLVAMLAALANGRARANSPFPPASTLGRLRSP
jgi:hypothetical protein